LEFWGTKGQTQKAWLSWLAPSPEKQEDQHPLTGQRAANFRLLATSVPNAG